MSAPEIRQVVVSSQRVLLALGPAIRARRVELGLTTREMAGRVPGFLDGRGLNRLETSADPPSLRLLLRIAEALQTTPSMLLAAAEAHALGGERYEREDPVTGAALPAGVDGIPLGGRS